MAEILVVIGKFFGNAAQVMWAFIIASILGYWMGAPESMHTIAGAALAMFIIDTVSGSVLAFKEKKFNIRKFDGALWKVIVWGLAVAAAVPLGKVFGVCTGNDYLITTVVLTIIFVRESLSTIKTLQCLGFTMPIWITERLQDMEEKCLEAPPDDPAKVKDECPTSAH